MAWLLPGGTLACRGAGGKLLVADPLSAQCLGAEASNDLRNLLAGHPGSFTVAHQPDGVRLQTGIPPDTPAQAATLLPPGAWPRADGDGASIVAWHGGGAVVWSLADAPAAVKLATSLGGVPLEAEMAPAPAHGWAAAGGDAVFDLLSPALAARVDDLLALELSDSLRWALVAACCDGPDCLASGLAEVLCSLPGLMQPDPLRPAGMPAAEQWDACLPMLADRQAPHVLLGLHGIALPRRAVLALRAALGARLVTLHTGADMIDLNAEAAFFAAAHKSLAVLLAPPEGGPEELYGLAQDIAMRAGANVLAAAPCWGFRHGIDADGRETGNAAWFGMGPSLEELDDFCLGPT